MMLSITDSTDSIGAKISMPGCEILATDPYKLGWNELGPLSEECLCDRVNAVTALEARHCTFESLYDLLRKDPAASLPLSRAKRWLTGLKYVRTVEHDGFDGQRTYDVFRVHERLCAEGVAEVRMVRLPGVYLRVAGIPQAGFPPRALTFTYFLQGAQFVNFADCPVDPEKYPLYADVDAVLRETKATSSMKLADAVGELVDRLRSAAGHQRSPQFLMFIDGLTRHHRSISGLWERVRAERLSLWDAPILDEFAMTPFEDRLKDRAWFSPHVAALGPKNQADLLRALLPIKEFDAAQRYIGAIPLCDRCLLS